MFRSLMYSAFAPTIALLALLAGAIAFGGPSQPPALDHIAERFDRVDWSGLPAPQSYEARDGAALAYRSYPGDPAHVVLAFHGSGGSGAALHPLARALNEAGATVIVPDIRGHGASGRRGDMEYSGQASDDADDLRAIIAADYPDARLTLLGFSMGGGLALREAARAPADDLILLSPYLAHDAPPMEAENPFAPETVWATPGVPRLIGLSILNGFGIHALDHLTVVKLATRPEDAEAVASGYSQRLMTSVQPEDWQADLAALPTTPVIFVGAEDELHHAPAYAEAAPGADIRIIPSLDHMGLTLDEAAIAQIVAVVMEEASK